MDEADPVWVGDDVARAVAEQCFHGEGAEDLGDHHRISDDRRVLVRQPVEHNNLVVTEAEAAVMRGQGQVDDGAILHLVGFLDGCPGLGRSDGAAADEPDRKVVGVADVVKGVAARQEVERFETAMRLRS